MNVSKHIESNDLLVSVEQSTEPFLILVAALVRDVGNQHSFPVIVELLQFFQIALDEGNLTIGIFKLVPEKQIVEVTALCVQREDTGLELCDVLSVVSMLIPSVLFRLRYPLLHEVSTLF